MSTKAEVVICGAGIAGVAAAYHLVVRHGVRDVVLVDEKPPLSLTSAAGTEAYRSWWPDEPMFRFMDRSISLTEELAAESRNAVRMNRRGYVFLTSDPRRIPKLEEEAKVVTRLGGGPLRVHRDGRSYVPARPDGLQPDLPGADLVLDTPLIARLFPFLADNTVAMLHVRRCGWLDVPSLGRWLLDRIASRGGAIVRDRIAKVDTRNERVAGVRLHSGSTIETGRLVLSSGPLIRASGRMLGLDLPVFTELHGKVVAEDTAGILPADAPMMIWTDPIHLVWNEKERGLVSENPDTRHLLDAFPAGLHVRPRFRDGKRTFLGIWTYDVAPREAVFPLAFDSDYATIVLRGLARMIPGMRAYLDTAVALPVDGGYYCKTPDNRPLIGPLPVEGAYIVGALSGYGVMGSQAAGALIADHITGGDLPDYAKAFSADRFEGLPGWSGLTGPSGQSGPSGLSAADMAAMGHATRGQL